ncbi:ABC transporter permease [Sporosarcina sp. FSL K6-1522]|uniref:ABC transporter permease n=1 Tax=Sporosarcina sp. FSL K6-1522 TaxID=2921554 RepID=UPI00315B1C55
MTLFNVVMKNLKHNFRQYTIYVASMTFSVLIYFTFVSLQYNEQIMTVSNFASITERIQPLLNLSSLILLGFIFIFIWYSNTFFMNRRKQEIGLYALLGAPKKEIGMMLFYENFLLSLMALIIGVGLGQLFSLFFSMILVKLMGYSILLHVAFNEMAVVQTLVVFIAITLLTSLQGYYLVYRFRLIELFQAKNKGQDPIKSSMVRAMLSVLLLGMSYWLLWNASDSKSWSEHFGRNLFVALLLMITGSFLLFHSFSGFVMQQLQNKKAIYYKWRNLITFTQLRSRLKSNAILLTLISVLNGITLVAFGFAYTIYYNTLLTMEDHVPFSYQYSVAEQSIDDQLTALIQQNTDFPLVFEETFEYMMVNGDARSLDVVPSSYHFYDEQFAVLPVTTYNQLAGQLNRKSLSLLEEHEVVTLGKNFIGSQNHYENVGHSLSLMVADEAIPLMVTSNRIESLFNYNVPPTTLIVHDRVYQKLRKEYDPIASHVFKVADEKQADALTEQVKELFEAANVSVLDHSQEREPAHVGLYTFFDNYQEAQSIYGLMIFTFGFLGLVFLSATGSIIYFKTLTEAAEDAKRYKTLRTIGMSKRKVKQVIARQSVVMFILPLVAGIAHSSMMLSALANVMDMNFITPVVISTLLYSILYGSYYIMTLVTGNKLVNT